MGWNSWNSFATTITEVRTLENARIMAPKLLPSGYDIFTVDIQWYAPNATGYDYRKDAKLTMDEYGSLFPAPNRFRSATKGRGAKVLPIRFIAWGCNSVYTSCAVFRAGECGKSHQNRPHRADPGTRIWSARAKGAEAAHFLALFNTEDTPVKIEFDLSRLNLDGKTVALRDLLRRRDLSPARGVIRQTLMRHGSALCA